jgi:general stress protein YciG
MAEKNNRNSGRQGFASMDEQKQREIASKGGQSQGKESNPGNFANDPARAAEAGRLGGQSRGQSRREEDLDEGL